MRFCMWYSCCPRYLWDVLLYSDRQPLSRTLASHWIWIQFLFSHTNSGSSVLFSFSGTGTDFFLTGSRTARSPQSARANPQSALELSGKHPLKIEPFARWRPVLKTKGVCVCVYVCGGGIVSSHAHVYKPHTNISVARTCIFLVVCTCIRGRGSEK